MYTGFAEMGAIAHYPDAESFARLLAEGHSAFNVWRAVVLRWLAEESEDGVGIPTHTKPNTYKMPTPSSPSPAHGAPPDRCALCWASQSGNDFRIGVMHGPAKPAYTSV